MKKIINGRVYDTATAREICSSSNGCTYRDHQWIEETMYQKRTGEFFLFGRGGPASKYAQAQKNNGWSNGEKLIPLTWEAAREWAEGHMSAEEYESAFGAVVEDNSRTVVTMSLSVSAVERAKRAAAQAGLSLSAYIESLIG